MRYLIEEGKKDDGIVHMILMLIDLKNSLINFMIHQTKAYIILFSSRQSFRIKN